MKKKILTVLAVLALFALAFAGCKTDGDDNNGTGTGGDGSSNTALSGIKVGGSDETVGAANAKETIGELAGNAMKNFNVSIGDKDAAVEFTPANQFEGTIKYAHTKAGADGSAAPAAAEADFKDYNKDAKPDNLDLKDGDKIYVQMTSGNKKKTAYYGFNILIGWDATLSPENGLVFGGKYSPSALGTDVANLNDFNTDAEAETGKMQFGSAQPAGGFAITAKPSDTLATVKLSRTGNGTDWALPSAFTGQRWDEGDFLYVQVVSQNTRATRYYKIEMIPLRSVTIPYGTPSSLAIANGVATASEWANASEWLPINRVNTTEGKGILNMPADTTRSHGRAKLMWDGDGIWIYAQVWEKTVSAQGGNHENSSVELFINEAYNAMLDDTTNYPDGPRGTVASSTNENGGQYRLGANGEKTGPQTNQTDAFNALGQSNAVKYTGGAAGNMPTSPQSEPGGIGTTVTTGYVLVYQAPWLFYDKYSLGDGKMVGIEIQINATGDNGNRVGVLNWNSASTNSYTSLAAFGEGTLKLGEGVTMGARRPQITTQPADQTILIKTSGTDAIKQLTVAATSPESGTIGADWYQTTLPDDFDIAGKTSVGTGLSYTPTVSNATEGVYYYFARVSNTVTGKATKYANSRMVLLAVVDPTQPIVVDLSRQAMTGWDGSGVGNRVQGTYDETAKSITWEFGKDEDETKNGDQRVAIALTPGQAASIQAAKALEVTIKGTAAPGSAAKYRCYIGTISTQNSWNGTDAFPGSASKFEAVGKADGIAHQVKMSGNIGSAGRGSYFILRSSAAGEDKVTITEITIVPKDTAWPTTP